MLPAPPNSAVPATGTQEPMDVRQQSHVVGQRNPCSTDRLITTSKIQPPGQEGPEAPARAPR